MTSALTAICENATKHTNQYFKPVPETQRTPPIIAATAATTTAKTTTATAATRETAKQNVRMERQHTIVLSAGKGLCPCGVRKSRCPVPGHGGKSLCCQKEDGTWNRRLCVLCTNADKAWMAKQMLSLKILL